MYIINSIFKFHLLFFFGGGGGGGFKNVFHRVVQRYLVLVV